jgi:diguanylate cyclase (GGDEF)-like protein
MKRTTIRALQGVALAAGAPLGWLLIEVLQGTRVSTAAAGHPGLYLYDEYGHPVGDGVLVNAARAIASITRLGETEARVGGEEFALLLPDSTGAEAREVAERVRAAIAANETPIPGRDGATIRITASAGVASTAEHPSASVQEIYRITDEALYRAKREGRNRTVVADVAE